MVATSKAPLALGYTFADDGLRVRALTHRSANAEHNERLEFLGDALLGLVIAEHLYSRYPDADEGQLTRARAQLVNRDSLAGIARRLDLGSMLVLGEGEQKSGGWRRASILANALESIIGAIYLDSDFDTCAGVVTALFAERLAEVDPGRAGKDAKTTLQEFLQQRQLPLPRYETVAVSGPVHDQEFTVSCLTELLGEAISASGPTRRKAEQAAARAVLERLDAASS
ncbi:MAG: ribonuclease III [Gammaproteobacteria bacterium]